MSVGTYKKDMQLVYSILSYI